MFPRQGTPLLEVKICKQMNQKLFLTGGFSGGTSGKESTCPCRCKRCRFGGWVGKIPWRGKWQPTPVFSPGKSMNKGAWRARVHGVTKESHTTERLNDNSSFSVRSSHSEKIKLKVCIISSKNMERETTVSWKL